MPNDFIKMKVFLRTPEYRLVFFYKKNFTYITIFFTDFKEATKNLFLNILFKQYLAANLVNV